MTPLDLTTPLRSAIINRPDVQAGLGQWEGEPSVHTRRPVPALAAYPMIVIGGNVTSGDRDGLRSRRPVVTRDIVVYGEAVRDFRMVEDLAESLKAFFHRNRFALVVPGFHVVELTADGPFPAPTDSDETVARAVPITLTLKDLST